MPQRAIVFVHGAWHSPDCFDDVITILSGRGFTSRKVYLPSVGRSPPISSLEPDIQAIRSAALTELQLGHDVTVVCHSYGGFPTNDAIKGLDQPQIPGGGCVSAIVYIAAMLLPEGITLNEARTANVGIPLDEYFELLDDGNLSHIKDTKAAEIFYNDLSPEEGSKWVSRLRTHAAVTFGIPTKYAAWKDIPSWYLIALQDKALFPEMQLGFIRDARAYLDSVGGPGTGEQRLRSQEIDASHSPFLSRPKETADFIESAAMARVD